MIVKMDNPNKLQQDYDSAFLALLMDEYTDKLGEKVLKEYEQAEESGEPDDSADAMCYQMIRDSKAAWTNGRRIKNAFRRVGIVAAVIAILLAMLIGVQAAGVDVFGALAKWTGEVFKFRVDDEAASDAPHAEEQNEMQKMLAELGMPVELAPTWLPEGYTLFRVEQINTDVGSGIYAAYENNNSRIYIEITEYYTPPAIDNLEIQMDNATPEAYKSNGKLFYLFTNMKMWRGAWSGENYVISLSGFPSRETIKNVIDSIGEITDE